MVEQAAAELSATVAETGFVWVSVRTPESMAAVANPVVLVDQSPAHPSPSPSRSRADR